MARDKVRIRFTKAGDLRLLSHHDLLRSFERILRRASIPFRSTEGFHPTPRIVFGLALPLGVAGLREVVELELLEEVPPENVLQRLREQAPPGIEFLSCVRIPTNLTGSPRKAVYRFRLFDGATPELLARRTEFLATPVCWAERSRPTPRRINIRPFVDRLEIAHDWLSLEMWVSPEGSARAEEVLRALELGPALERGDWLERTDLLLVDEMEAGELARAPELALSRGPAAGAAMGAGPREPKHEERKNFHPAAAPLGPVVE